MQVSWKSPRELALGALEPPRGPCLLRGQEKPFEEVSASSPKHLGRWGIGVGASLFQTFLRYKCISQGKGTWECIKAKRACNIEWLNRGLTYCSGGASHSSISYWNLDVHHLFSPLSFYFYIYLFFARLHLQHLDQSAMKLFIISPFFKLNLI